MVASDASEGRWRVFVSHTSELRDFPADGSYVAAVERAISACGHVIVEMAGFPAADVSAAEMCRERVRSCDVYIGVLGIRYGSVVRDMPLVSYTELEFDTATEAGLPRLVFVLDTDTAAAGIPLSPVSDPESGARQETFRRRVRGSLVTQSFSDPGTLGQLVERSLRALTVRQARAAPAAAGRLLAEVTDPFALEVHRPVDPGEQQPGLPVLPSYVAREHDRELAAVVRAGAGGSSGIAVLVGGSSTGKTRACWEALRLLREAPEPWRLWHPIDPSRPEAALRELPLIGPRTVVWLNEAQFYLDVPDGTGERVAAGLRELLRDPDRGPVLVLATLWPQFWDALTARREAGTADPHAQARDLLSGRVISVPGAFTPDQVRQLNGSGDPRLVVAAAAADGQVVQFLAGAPELLARYRNAPPAAAALISAGIDARRLGMGIALPRAFLAAAAPGYLTDSEWDALGDDWLEQALDYTAADCNGARGPLTRIRPRPGQASGAASGPAYRLADYLDQHGRRSRRSLVPPAEFWTAAAGSTDPGDLDNLAWAAWSRGLLCDAARLYKRAAGHGNASAAAALISSLHVLHPGDGEPARWAAAHVSLTDPAAITVLLTVLREAGATEQTAALLARDPARHAALDDPGAIAALLDALREAGATDQATALATRGAAHSPLDNPFAIAVLLRALGEAGATEQATALATRAAAHSPLGDPFAITALLDALREAGATDHATALATRAAAHSPLNKPHATARLLDALRRAGATDQVTSLATRAAAHSPLHNPLYTAMLLDALRRAGATDQATDLATRAAASDHPRATTMLIKTLRRAGAADQAAALLARAAAHSHLDDPAATAELLEALREAGAADQAAVLLARDPARHAILDDPSAAAMLLDALRVAGARDQAAALLARDPARHVTIDKPHYVSDNPSAISELLDALLRAGAPDQAATLADRVAAQSPLDNQTAVVLLLQALSEAHAADQAETLTERLPGEGQFAFFRRLGNRQTQYKFGREPDGHAALEWGWGDLD